MLPTILKSHRQIFSDHANPTFRMAFDSDAPVLTCVSEIANPSTPLNMSDVYTKLIQFAGRYSNRYASDLLVDIDIINHLLERAGSIQSNEAHMFVFGFRDSGVDGNNYVLNTIQKHMDVMSGYVFPELNYRAVLALEIKIVKTGQKPQGEIYALPRVEACLKDITHSLYKMHTADILSDRPIHFTDSVKYVEPTDDETIENFMKTAYNAYQLHWLRINHVQLSAIIAYASENQTTDGFALSEYNKMSTFQEFQTRELMSEDYMKDILTDREFSQYLAIMDKLYLE